MKKYRAKIARLYCLKRPRWYVPALCNRIQNLNRERIACQCPKAKQLPHPKSIAPIQNCRRRLRPYLEAKATMPHQEKVISAEPLSSAAPSAVEKKVKRSKKAEPKEMKRQGALPMKLN